MKTRLLIMMLLIAILMSACSPSRPTTNDKGDDECAPPLYNITFPIVTPQPSSTVTPRQISPRGNWQIQDTLPFPDDEFGSIYMRPRQNELLFTGQFDKIFIYSINNKQWMSYQENDRISDGLFVAKDGTIWGAGTLFADKSHSRKSYPYLRKFNDTTGKFEFIEDVSGFLQSPQVRLISNIVEDQAGLLWFFVEADKNTLVSFDVKTRQSYQYYKFEIGGGNPNIVIGQDSSLWFQDYANDKIVQYIPATQETHSYKAYPEEAFWEQSTFEKAGYIFMDSSKRLWFANYGWLDVSDIKSPEWHRIIESPVFVTDRGMSESQYFMGGQYSTYQSSNGWYWFTGINGIVRLDLEKEAWCLTTTGISNVVEDNDHNLWIAVFGRLYKYPLKH